MTEPDVGPGWVDRSVQNMTGRFPLAVESHVTRQAARLVPGVTTVTTGGRYFTLHAAVAAERRRRALTDSDAVKDLIRRCETVVAAVSARFPDTRYSAPHGYSPVRAGLERDGFLNLARLAQPSSEGYSTVKSGFYPTYVQSERTLGLLDPRTTAFLPGPGHDQAAADEGFAGLFDLTARDEIGVDELDAHAHLAVGAAAATADGVGFARLLCSLIVPDQVKAAEAEARRGTMRVVGRAMEVAGTQAPLSALRQVVAAGPWLTEDPVFASVTQAGEWRGTIWRHYFVTAYRVLWARLTDLITVPVTRAELAAEFADRLRPAGATLGTVLTHRPSGVHERGVVAPAERDLRHNRDLDQVLQALLLIAVAADRSQAPMTPEVRQGFLGPHVRPLDPSWMWTWLNDRTGKTVDAFALDLVNLLLDRAHLVAVRKPITIDRYGIQRFSNTISESGGYLTKTETQSDREVGIRIDQLVGIGVALGLYERSDTDPVTDPGREWLDLL